jgi:hypothetical protein
MYVYINESPKKKVASRRGWTSQVRFQAARSLGRSCRTHAVAIGLWLDVTSRQLTEKYKKVRCSR